MRGDAQSKVAKVGVLLHIGAGFRSKVTDDLASGAQRIILVEPNPTALRTLKQLTANDSRVQIIAAAICRQKGTARLNVFNHASFASLHEPTGLLKLFPGLRVVEQPTVATMNSNTLMEHITLEKEKWHQLIINAPGEEQAILEDLDAGGWLTQFKQLTLFCGFKPLYENSADAATLLDWLNSRAYRLVATIDAEDPHWPRFDLVFDPIYLERNQLRTKLKIAVEERNRLEAELQQEKNKTQTMEQKNQELLQRQTLMQEEMIKAEAQIELIKELVLPEFCDPVR